MARVAAVLAAFLCVASPSFASGVVSLTWDWCTGPLSKTVAPGSVASLYMSVTGQADLHKAYEVRVILTRDCTKGIPPFGGGPLPDAWRFDAVGCQTPAALRIDHAIPVLPSGCPNFSQGLDGLQVKQFNYDPVNGAAEILLANYYGFGVPSVDPAKRYALALFVFDQARGVVGPSVGGNCGGLETPLCMTITSATYLAPDGTQLFWQLGNRCVSVNDPTNVAGCDAATPARPTTWGAIRGQYR